MDLVSLHASPRVVSKGTTRSLRREGFLPVVLYGHGIQSRPLKVRAKDFERILVTGAGRNNLIRLEIEGERTETEPPTVMVKDIQSDPVKGRHIHADLQQISLKERIRAKVRLHIVGEEPIRNEGGIVQHQMREVEVECLPTELPDHLTVDLTGLGIGDSVTLGELKVPAGVRVVGEPDEVVASIVAPKMVAEEVPAAAEGAEAAEPAKAEPARVGEQEEEKEEE